MKKRRGGGAAGTTPDLGGALAALDAVELRTLVGEILLEFDGAAHERVVRLLVERAARANSGWKPASVSDAGVSDVYAFVLAATRVGYADPADVDALLARGSDAFLHRNYTAAHAIFGALLKPMGEAEFDLGQDEMVDEVLDTDLHQCGARYVVSTYMVTAPLERPSAVLDALGGVGSVSYVSAPLAEMERAALESLPRFAAFLPAWQALLEKEVAGKGRRVWGGDRRSWLRDVVGRLEGATGLADLARSSGNAEDNRAWCDHLVKAKDWKGALAAYEEAALRVAAACERADFLDGAALCAQAIGRRDVPARLERAWRTDPNMLRLARWLGTAGRRSFLAKRAREALDDCPKEHKRQRALLQVLSGDLPSAARLLASAPGLGWSAEEHPGHVLFPLFETLLGEAAPAPATLRFPRAATAFADWDDPFGPHDDDDREEASAGPYLPPPTLPDLLTRVGVRRVKDAAVRKVLLGAMRKSAETRIAGVTDKQRRCHYGHAAELVAAVAACDPSSTSARWVASVRETYRRYPALRRALDRQVGRD